MDVERYDLKMPKGCNVILGQAHFIKTAEDLYEALTTSCPSAKFGLAFSEASGPCLVRTEGTDESLENAAAEALLDIGCGHAFIIYMKDIYPINLMRAVKAVPEVCHIFCATANPVQVLTVRSEQGGGIVGVIDGAPPKGVETENDVQTRRKFLREIGYKK